MNIFNILYIYQNGKWFPASFGSNQATGHVAILRFSYTRDLVNQEQVKYFCTIHNWIKIPQKKIKQKI